TATRISRRDAASCTSPAHAVSSAITCSLNALRTSGRLSVRRSTGPSRREVMNSYVIRQDRPCLRVLCYLCVLCACSHAEDTELRLGNRRVEGRRQSERQRLPRLCWIENPVVPQPGGRVVGRSLELVFIQDRLPDGVFVLDAE